MCHPFLVLLNTSKAYYYLVIEYRYVNISNNGCPYIDGVCEDSPRIVQWRSCAGWIFFIY